MHPGSKPNNSAWQPTVSAYAHLQMLHAISSSALSSCPDCMKMLPVTLPLSPLTCAKPTCAYAYPSPSPPCPGVNRWNLEANYTIDVCAFLQWTYYNCWFFLLLIEADSRLLSEAQTDGKASVSAATSKVVRFFKLHWIKIALFSVTQVILIAFLVVTLNKGEYGGLYNSASFES